MFNFLFIYSCRFSVKKFLRRKYASIQMIQVSMSLMKITQQMNWITKF